MNFLGMGPMELLLIIVLALIVFGPAKLPEIMGQVGKAINDFRRATSDLSEEFNKTIQAELAETRAVVDEAKSVVTDARSAVTDVHTSVNSAVTGVPAPTRVAEPGALTSNGTNGTGVNGTAPHEPTPQLADTSKWSWETAAPPEPKTTPEATTPVAETGAPAVEVEVESSGSAVELSSPSVEATAPATEAAAPKLGEAAFGAPAEAPAQQPRPRPASARDDLAPPY